MGTGGSKCLAVTATACVLVGMVASSLLTERDERLRIRLGRFATEHARLAGAGLARTPLHGEPHAGDAFVFYVAAASQMAGAERAFAGWCNPGLDAASSEAAWTAVEPIVGTLRLGAMTAVGTRETGRGCHWLGLRRLLQFAQRRAAGRHEWPDAVRLWLDEQALVRDFGWLPDDSSFAAWTAPALQRLCAEAAGMLAVGLARMDDSLALPDDPTSSLSWVTGDALQRAAAGGASLRDRLLSWPSGFDPGRHELLGIAELIGALPDLQPPAPSWPQRNRQWQRFVGRVGSVQGRFVAGWAEQQRLEERRRRLALARVRLLRLALAFTIGEPLPPLADPFAEGAFQSDCDGDVATFRSAASPQVLELRALRR